MTSESTCRSKLAEFVTDHVFSYIYRNKSVTVMNCDSMADKVR